jgi:hypothetical protein
MTTIRIIAAAVLGAVALAGASAALADTDFVSDPDESGLAAFEDIEWGAVDHPPPPSVFDTLVRHTIKTRAPYGPARTPRLFLRVPRSDRPGKYYYYRIPGGNWMSGPDGPVRIVRVETPVGAPDTVSYTFELGQIGNPAVYQWRAETASLLAVDRLPDDGWIVHKLQP